MAQGDLLFFNDFVDDIGKKLHNLDTDQFMFALIDNTIIPSVTTANPTWGAGGTTNLSANEVSGTGYTAGGIDITSTFSTSAAVGTFDGSTNPSWTQNGAGPTNIYWGIIYNNTVVNKDCVAFIDMGGPISLQAGDISYTFNASGIGTITRT